jgi:hypothetical protein
VAIATYKDLCIDAVDAGRLGRFWAGALGLRAETLDDGDVKLVGATPQHTVWINAVPEPVTVKQRVHVDVRRDVADLVDLGGEVLDAESFRWTVMRDPEGGELCTFAPREGKPLGYYELVVDTDGEPLQITRWWGRVLGCRPQLDSEAGFGWIEGIPGCPFESIVFVPVPEPKTVKNRIHLGVTTADVGALVTAGAVVLREPDDEVEWHVMADPDGNEFCAFLDAPDRSEDPRTGAAADGP